MSECVVRMKMPNSCYDCEIRDGKAYCPICGATLVGYKRSRHENCPILCQLPEGHGRLVDANKEIDFHINDFERIKTEGIDVYSKAYSLSDLCDGITYAYDHAPTIVPAERSET